MSDQQWDFERVKRELEKMTPGGERFHNNPQECILYLQKLHKRVFLQYLTLFRTKKGKRNERSN